MKCLWESLLWAETETFPTALLFGWEWLDYCEVWSANSHPALIVKKDFSLKVPCTLNFVIVFSCFDKAASFFKEIFTPWNQCDLLYCLKDVFMICI